jgi:hypothetical protein
MFKLNETVFTKAGYEARIVCVDANVNVSNGIKCDYIALLKPKPGVIAASTYLYSEDGKLSGMGNPQFDLVSNTPNAEEASLITDILSLSPDSRDAEDRLLKIIRRLRAK